MRLRARRGMTIITAILGLGAGLACTGGAIDTDPATDTDIAASLCPLGTSASRDALVSLTQFRVGVVAISASVDATIDDPSYGPSVCVGDSSARLLIIGDGRVLAVLTLRDVSLGSVGLAGHATVDYLGNEGNATFAEDSWQSGTLAVTADAPLTFSIANGFAVSNEGFTLTLVGQAEIVRP